jgi:hypothetical protein
MTSEEALRVAARYIERKEPEAGCELVVLESNTIEKNFGWVFFYDTRRHVETKDFRFALAGNAPIIVIKESGVVQETGTAYPLEHYVSELSEKYKRE